MKDFTLDALLAVAIGLGLAGAFDFWVFKDPGYIDPDLARAAPELICARGTLHPRLRQGS